MIQTTSDILSCLNNINPQTPSNVILETLENSRLTLEKITSSSLTLLPALLQLLPITNPTIRISLISLLQKIMKTCSNYEPITCTAVFNAALEGIAFLSSDQNIPVIKQLLLCSTLTYPILFRFLCRHPKDPKPWTIFSNLKSLIFSLVYHSNDGVKIASLKFLQMVAIIQSPKDASLLEKNYPSLDDIPLHHPFMKSNELRPEGVNAFNTLISLLSSDSSASVMTATVNSLLVITQNRSEYIDFTVKTLAEWQNFPPHHFTSMETKSVGRAIKVFMLCLLRLPSAEPFLEFISEYLMEIGVRSMEIQMRMQQKSSSNKRAFTTSDWEEESKRIKMEQDRQLSLLFSKTVDVYKIPIQILIEIILQTLVSTPVEDWETGINIFKQTNGMMPANIPSDISTLSIADSAIKQEPTDNNIIENTADVNMDSNEPHVDIDPHSIMEAPRELFGVESRQVFQEILYRFFELEYRFSEATVLTNLAQNEIETDSLAAAKNGWMLLLSRLLTRSRQGEESQEGTFGQSMRSKDVLISFILDDFKERLDLAVLWLHEEYFKESLEDEISSTDTYFTWFHKVLYGIQSAKADGTFVLDPKDRAFTKFLLEVPELSDESIFGVLKSYCDQEERMPLGISTLRDLILYRPAVRDSCLDILLNLCTHHDKSTRATAIVTCKKFYLEHFEVGPKVESFALQTVLRLLKPPLHSEDIKAEAHEESVKATEMEGVDAPNVIVKQEIDSEAVDVVLDATKSLTVSDWKDEEIVQHLELFFSMCSKNNDLLDKIFTLFPVFTESIQKVVRVHIGGLIKAMSQNPSKLLSIIEEFPEDTEPLLLRIIIILSEKLPISQDLIRIVKKVYYEKDLDARFLIPIITHLPKAEILQELPKILQILDGSEGQKKIIYDVLLKIIQPRIVLGVENEATVEIEIPPLVTPVELMMAMHTMEESIGLKIAVEATSICFSASQIFTQETLAVVLQQLVDLSTLPTLLMRTVIQSVTIYRELAGFVNSIMTRLISKKIWTLPKLWEGFIRCCTVIFNALITCS